MPDQGFIVSVYGGISGQRLDIPLPSSRSLFFLLFSHVDVPPFSIVGIALEVCPTSKKYGERVHVH